MNLKTYSKLAKRTLSPIDGVLLNVVHMLLGMSTELGELQDQYKKYIAYGKQLDLINVQEEVGDLMWYIINLCTMLDFDLEKILDQNIAKLKTRYPEKFTEHQALNRNLDDEHKVLTGYSQMSLTTEPE